MKRRYLLRGVYVALGIVLCIAIAFLVSVAFSYDGKCGGFFPGVSAPDPCSFWEYLSEDIALFAILLAVAYWPIALSVLLLPPLVGYWLDRRG
jgi:hypothetical protein